MRPLGYNRQRYHYPKKQLHITVIFIIGALGENCSSLQIQEPFFFTSLIHFSTTCGFQYHTLHVTIHHRHTTHDYTPHTIHMHCYITTHFLCITHLSQHISTPHIISTRDLHTTYICINFTPHCTHTLCQLCHIILLFHQLLCDLLTTVSSAFFEVILSLSVIFYARKNIFFCVCVCDLFCNMRKS